MIKRGYLLACIFIILGISLVVANDSSPAVGQGIHIALKCKTDFSISIMNSLQNVGANLSIYITTLQEDLAKVEPLSDDRDALRDFVKNTYEKDIKNSREAVNQWRKDQYRNLTKEQKTTLQQAYQDARTSFDGCQLDALKALSDKRVQDMKDSLVPYQSRIDKLSEKGLDVTELQKILADAQIQIITPLQNALDSAKDAQSIQDALRKYCLFNGCRNGVNYHLEAKFETERLNQILAYLQKNNSSNETAQKLAQAQIALNSAKGLLLEIGTTNFGDQGKQLWSTLKSVQQILKETYAMHTEVKHE